jgi:hypothetical protein
VGYNNERFGTLLQTEGNRKMDLKTAAKRFRRWQKDGMVTSAGSYFFHETRTTQSQQLFTQAVTILGGKIEGLIKSDDFITIAVLPDDALPLVEPRSSRGRPAGTKGGGRPKLPEGQHRIQQGARFHPDTKPLAKAIADKLELDNWAWAVDEAVRRMAKEEGIKIK